MHRGPGRLHQKSAYGSVAYGARWNKGSVKRMLDSSLLMEGVASSAPHGQGAEPRSGGAQDWEQVDVYFPEFGVFVEAPAVPIIALNIAPTNPSGGLLVRRERRYSTSPIVRCATLSMSLILTVRIEVKKTS